MIALEGFECSRLSPDALCSPKFFLGKAEHLQILWLRVYQTSRAAKHSAERIFSMQPYISKCDKIKIDQLITCRQCSVNLVQWQGFMHGAACMRLCTAKSTAKTSTHEAKVSKSTIASAIDRNFNHAVEDQQKK